MNFFLQRRNIILLLGFLVLILVVIVLLRSSGTQQTKIASSPIPTAPTRSPLPFPLASPTDFEYSDQYKKEAEKINQQQDEILRRDQQVSKLIDKLPVQGASFSAEYSDANGKIILKLVAGSETEGNQKFDKFLQDNGVQRDWLRNLETQVQ